jgi:hypothetical protein
MKEIIRGMRSAIQERNQDDYHEQVNKLNNKSKELLRKWNEPKEMIFFCEVADTFITSEGTTTKKSTIW